MRNFSLLLLILFSFFCEVISYDCYKYSKSEFATIKSCPYGCQYEYKTKGSRNQKESGGCTDEWSTPGCQQKGKKTVCSCAENYCNKRGYDMEASSEEHV